MDLHEIVKKLVGEISPIGETNTDDQRFENLKVMADLVDKLMTDMDRVTTYNKNAPEFSRKRAAEYVSEFFDGIGIEE